MDTGTFFGTFESKINDWESNIKTENDPVAVKRLEAEMHNYMAKCLPYVMAYMKDETTTEAEGPFDIKITKGVQRKEIYMEYLKNVEGYKGVLDVKQQKVNRINKKSAKTKLNEKKETC